jgi:DNA-binding LytR/AlgR family response regulator
MNVLIIEDELLTAQRLEKMLKNYDKDITVVDKISSVSNAIKWLTNPSTEKPDLIFMDIHLEDDIAFKIIDETQTLIPIIFTTAYDEYMLQAFKANSVDYLLKPIDEDELVTALKKFKDVHQVSNSLPKLNALLGLLNKTQSSLHKDRFMVTVGTRIKSIDANDISYFYFEEKSTFMVTHDNQNLLLDYSLDKLLSLLNPKMFFRINRSAIISLKSIQNIHTISSGKLKLDLLPKSKREFFVSGDRITDFKEWLGK